MSPLIRPEATFCKTPFCGDLAALDGGIAVFGAPHGTPYQAGEPSHAAGGAAAVRSALSWYSTGPDKFDFDTMTTVFGGHRVMDCGDAGGDLMDGTKNRNAIRGATKGILLAGAVPILLGGDDSVPIPFIEGYDEYSDALCIVQIDAHIDWRDEVDGVTHGFSSTMRRASEMNHVTSIIQIGARGPGSARQSDLADARDWGVRFFTGRDVHASGVQAAINAVPDGCDVVLSVDVDGLDPSIVPGVILPAFGGLSYQQMLDIIYGLAAKARIVGADFVEYVPEKDPTGTGAQAIARLACNVIASASLRN